MHLLRTDRDGTFPISSRLSSGKWCLYLPRTDRAIVLPLVLLLQLGKDAKVFQRGGIAFHLIARSDLLEQPAHDLATAGLGERLGEADLVRLGEAADLLGDFVGQRL